MSAPGQLLRRARVLWTLSLTLLLWVTGAAAAKDSQEGNHIVALVVEVVPRADVVASGENGVLGMLLASGVNDAEITDGSIVVGMVYCCGGKISRQTALAIYVPTKIRASKGDVVELLVGRAATKKERKRGEHGVPNRLLAVREAFTDQASSCRWDPPNEKLWMRVLYCDWMLGENWQYKGGLTSGWFRPAELSPEP